jgi:hypothetical protein
MFAWKVLKCLLAALLTACERLARSGAFRLPPT